MNPFFWWLVGSFGFFFVFVIIGAVNETMAYRQHKRMNEL